MSTCTNCGRPVRGEGDYTSVCEQWPYCQPAQPEKDTP